MPHIRIRNAWQGTLDHISVDLPKNSLTVVTGVSGSGKSTLLVDVLFQECQRKYLEALSMQGIAKPGVERIQGASPAVLIPQTAANRSPRSTVGTLTDIYTELRMLFEKLGRRRCSLCGTEICAADSPEITERRGDDFLVWMDCPACGGRLRKLTRTDFSFNTKEGACPACQGLGQTLAVRRAAAVDESRSLEAGAVDFWPAKYREYQIGLYAAACRWFGLPEVPDVPVAQFSPRHKTLLYEGTAALAEAEGLTPPASAAQGRFEGIEPMLQRRLAAHEGDTRGLESYFEMAACPACQGERLNEESRRVTVEGARLPELAALSLGRLLEWVDRLESALAPQHRPLVKDYLADLHTKLARLRRVGLGYLTPDRRTVTLSGGESQRLRLAAALDADLTGLIYILDEPTAGLHPRDTRGLIGMLQHLRDEGNTVLVIEHDPEVMRAADWIVDMGPGAGRQGGRVVAAGTPAQVAANPDSATGRWLNACSKVTSRLRKPTGAPIRVQGACRNNLRRLSLTVPGGCITTVTGPSGAGKSTLVFDLIAGGDRPGETNGVEGCARFARRVCLTQTPPARGKRSNVATYTDAWTPLRALFAACPEARAKGLTGREFSFNTPGGRCETCQGLGVVPGDLLFFADAQQVCPDCGGKRFRPEVLAVQYRGVNVSEALDLTVDEAARLFAGSKKLDRVLQLLQRVGLGYLTLGQTLPTLSGGEAQRLLLARELLGGAGADTLYLMDEPTRGLHPQDVQHFLSLLDELTEAGGTVILVEHDPRVILHSDWVVDLGPGGGEDGGALVFTGTPADLLASGSGVTADCLRSLCDMAEAE